MVNKKKEIKSWPQLTTDGQRWEITTWEKKKNGLTKSKEMIKSAGQTAGHRSDGGCVNGSVPQHFCHAGQSLSTGHCFQVSI